MSFNPCDPILPPITCVEHPMAFRTGARILLLKSRHKDGYVGKERAIMRASNDVESFNRYLEELRWMLRPGERVYASASARSLMKAGRHFNERLVNASYDPLPVREAFFERLPYHWYSCLMQVECSVKDDRWWMWDIDTDEQRAEVDAFLAEGHTTHYRYDTKSGEHVLVRPFDRTKFNGVNHPDMNPLILWGYR